MVGLVAGSLLRLYYYMCIRFCWFVFSGSTLWGGLRDKSRGVVAIGLVLLGGYLRFLLAGRVCG